MQSSHRLCFFGKKVRLGELKGVYKFGMKLTEADLLEFKAICKEELGLELSDAEVAEEARQLINLVKLVYSHPRATR